MTTPSEIRDPRRAMPTAGTDIQPASRRGVISWYLFDWAAQPVATLITTFVFAPFFVDYIAEGAGHDSDSGQAIWGWTLAAAGIVIALLSPVLGAIADAAGRRKPWVAAFSVPLVIGCGLLWFTEPGASGAVAFALAGVFLATIGAEFATVFTNAMMPNLVRPDRLGRLSGSGWAIGYLGGVVSLVILLGLLVADPDDGETFFGLSPLFGLDPATYEGVRATGPLAVLWYLAFVPFLFLFTPDAPRMMAAGAAVRTGLRAIRGTLTGIRRHANAFRFLVAHMIYADGLAGLFAFGGVYATSTFGWGTTEFLLFGMIVVIAAVPGAFFGGRLDDRIGSKRIIVTALIILILASIAALSITSDRILFFLAADPAVEGDGMYATLGEKLYLLVGAIIGAVSGPLQAASRTLIVKLSPRDKVAEFFGLYALSGRLTTFLAAASVAAITALADSQRIGISVLLVFFVVGGLILLGVRPPARG